MFAGAAREVVFSDPRVVRQIQTGFIPVALKAGLVNNPPGGIEGELYREINRTKAAPQGICVMNSAGKVLDWVLSFDDLAAMRDFFEYVADRYKEFPETQKSLPTRRFRSYPTGKMEDIKDSGRTVDFPASHRSEHCPAERMLAAGTLVGKVIGRPIDENGEPVEATLHQEQYMEAVFDISTTAQRELVTAFRDANSKRFAVPDSFVDAMIGPAYLGQLDVSPLHKVPTGKNKERWWKFTAEQVTGDDTNQTDQQQPQGQSADAITLRIIGRSHLVGEGNQWDHSVSLDWQGYVDLKDDLVSRLDVVASGQEKLRWHVNNQALKKRPASATLMGGHPIDLDSGVVYGLKAQTFKTR